MEKNFFTVGDLSEMTGVSKQAIRYYDKIGLLKPEKIDEHNGYRYYQPIQILYLNSIMRLTQLGCSLKETGKYLYGDDLASVRRMLDMRGDLTRKKIQELTNALSSLENQISLIEQGMAARDTDGVFIKTIPERYFLYVANCIPLDIRTGILQVNTLVNLLYRQGMLFVGSPVFEYIKDKNLLKTGYFYHEEIRKDEFQTEIIPKGDYACMYHRGAYQNISKTVQELTVFLERQGRKMQSNIFQIYIIDYALTQEEDELLTELQVRLEK